MKHSRKLEKQGKKIFKFGFGQSPFQGARRWLVDELKNNATKINIYQCKVCLELKRCSCKTYFK